jgi:ubiquinone/menaquinone biosynthesis C-methylase UbiE
MTESKLSHETVKNYIKAYWNWRSSDYGRFRGYGSKEERTAWEKTLMAVFGEERLDILDIGTGTGYIAVILAQMGHNVTGVDISEQMLEMAKKRAKELSLKIKFELCDAENLHFEDESFDAVICRYVLWTLPNPRRAIGEWVRVVKPRGKIVVIDGKWFDRSVSSRLRRVVGRLGILIYEKRNPWRYRYRKEVSVKLPFRSGVEQEDVVELFKDFGLSKIIAQDLAEVKAAQRKNMPLLYKIAWNYPIFMVKGEKWGDML